MNGRMNSVMVVVVAGGHICKQPVNQPVDIRLTDNKSGEEELFYFIILVVVVGVRERTCFDSFFSPFVDVEWGGGRVTQSSAVVVGWPSHVLLWKRGVAGRVGGRKSVPWSCC